MAAAITLYFAFLLHLRPSFICSNAAELQTVEPSPFSANNFLCICFNEVCQEHGTILLVYALVSVSVCTQINEQKIAIRAAAVFSVLSLLYLTTAAFPFQRGLGVASYFPERIAKFTEEKNLQGNLLNSYSMGGYLIWSLYPERKIFIDGRNEVYLPLLKQIVQSRADSRLWNKLLADYKIEYALLNYIDELEEVTYMGKNGEITKTYMPFSETHFPRSKWALIYWDDIGMILVKRDGQNANLLPLEFKHTYPEGSNYMEALVANGRISRETAQNELKRKLNEDPHCKRAQMLLDTITSK